MDRVLTDFVKTLRNASIQVSTAETLDAMEVIEKIGYNNREILKNALSFALPKSLEEKERFNICFEYFINDSAERITDDAVATFEINGDQ